MTGERVTPGGIALIPLMLALAIALTGYLVVTMFAHHESAHCDELIELVHGDNPLKPGSDEYQTLDAIGASC